MGYGGWGSTYQHNNITDPTGEYGDGMRAPGPSIWSPGYWNPASFANPQPRQRPQAVVQQQPQRSTPQLTAPSLAGMGFGGAYGGEYGGGGTTASVKSAIKAGPVYDEQQASKALSSFDRMRPSGANGDLYDFFAQPMRVEADRGIAAGNAAHQLRSEVARSGSGLGWGRNAMQSQQINRSERNDQQDMAFALLRMLGVM